MKKIATTLGIGLLVLVVLSLSFGITTVLSSAFIQTTAAEDDGISPTTTAIEPVVNPAASPKYDSPDYGFTYLTYRVKRGDDLTHIAWQHSSDMYKISVDELQQLNNIKNPNRILVGQKLRLPVYYAKEVQAVIPEMVQTAAYTMVVQKEAELAKVRREDQLWSSVIMIVGALFFAALAIHAAMRARKNSTIKSNEKHTEPEKFFSYPDEIRAKLQKCTGQEIAEILESDFAEIPRGPGSAATNKVKVKNEPELMKKYPELLSMSPELWGAHLAAKMNQIAPTKATAQNETK